MYYLIRYFNEIVFTKYFKAIDVLTKKFFLILSFISALTIKSIRIKWNNSN